MNAASRKILKNKIEELAKKYSFSLESLETLIQLDHSNLSISTDLDDLTVPMIHIFNSKFPLSGKFLDSINLVHKRKGTATCLNWDNFLERLESIFNATDAMEIFE